MRRSRASSSWRAEVVWRTLHGNWRRYLFAGAVTLVALAAAAAIRMLTGAGPALLMAFFPALLAITFYSGAGPAVLGWLFCVCAAGVTWGGSVTHPVLATSERWALAAFALSTALSIAIGARARRSALAEQSELLRVEAQARDDVSRAEENKHRALSKLSHDLRTPLSTIIGWAQVLRAQNPPEQMLHGLEVIERNARAQTRIIQDLLDDGRTPAEESTAERAPGSPAERAQGSPAQRSPGSPVERTPDSR